jgi:hypothetical protein
MIAWFIVSAAKDETRLARLSKVMDASADGRRLL